MLPDHGPDDSSVQPSREPSRCGCAPHCVVHEAAKPITEIDCIAAALIFIRFRTYEIERRLDEATDLRWHSDHRDRERRAVEQACIDLMVAVTMTHTFAKARLGTWQ